MFQGPKPEKGKFLRFDHIEWWVGNALQVKNLIFRNIKWRRKTFLLEYSLLLSISGKNT
jgi:hypothetical protein